MVRDVGMGVEDEGVDYSGGNGSDKAIHTGREGSIDHDP